MLGNLHSAPHERVIVGYNGQDDAAVIRLDDGRLLVQTVDFFTPVVDDPYLFGQIAAANSLSDIYAMGAKPLFALNIVAFPVNDLPKSMLTTILQGGTDKAREAGIPIVGGHSVDDKEPKYGLVVTGEVEPKRLVTNTGAQPGDLLVLTKPLGTGIIATAIKRDIASENAVQVAVDSMTTLNKLAADVMTEVEVHAATDVTGFGLLGHLLELCRTSHVSAAVDFSALVFLPDVLELAKEGVIPGGTRRNLTFVQAHTQFEPEITLLQELLICDAQTSGGLLLALPPDSAKIFLEKFNNRSKFPAVIVGKIIEP
ncbi:MAG: selenide, water dikinase SelD, partial [FCB group bacterium]|nr:selenide, water dikinase SelD [FCB group bacterium]